jgi:hypothetical protein
MGSPLVRVDVVPLSRCAARNATTVFGTQTIGQPEGMPSRWTARGTFEYRWDGKLADSTYAPPGHYRFAIKALHIFGDAELESEYDATETVDFWIRYLPAPDVRVGVGRTRRQDECEG